MNYNPLFSARSWNNGMRSMSLYILSDDDDDDGGDDNNDTDAITTTNNFKSHIYSMNYV